MVPLIVRLKKQRHRDIALAHDIVIEVLFNIFDKAVLHGGTAIWRCYKGNRFSEDIDVYIPRDIKKLDLFFDSLEKKGFVIEKKKISENSLFSNLSLNRTAIRLEAIFRKADGILKEYETTEGNLMTIYTLSPEELIDEKVNTYLKRLKIRDLYDIFFLLREVNNKSEIIPKIKILITNFKPPIDKNELNILILEGLVPNTEKMLDYIKSYIGNK